MNSTRKTVLVAGTAIAILSLALPACSHAAGLTHPIDHCRLVNYQPSGGLTLGATLTFSACLTDSSSQGGQSISCGIPTSAAAIHVSIVAVNPTGSGAFRTWPAGGNEPAVSVALNYFKAADTGTPTYTPAPGRFASIKLGVGANACLFNVEPYYTAPGGVIVDVEEWVD